MAKGELPQVNHPDAFNPKPAPNVPPGNDVQVYQPLLHLLLGSKYSSPSNLQEAQDIEKHIFPSMVYGGSDRTVGPVPAPLGLVSSSLKKDLLKNMKDKK